MKIAITVYENITALNDYRDREVELVNVGGTLYARYVI